LKAFIHYGDGTNYPNSSWILRDKVMQIGESDNVDFLNLATRDVITHEISHGVTERCSKLNTPGEIDGLNESFSDIMATCLKASLNNWTINNELWEFGRGVLANPNVLRHINNPALDGAQEVWSQNINGIDGGAGPIDEHFGLGVSNLAFFLMSNGGQHPNAAHRRVGHNIIGIGVKKACKVFYAANCYVWTANTDFRLAQVGTISAARRIGLSGVERNSIKEAWIEVGVCNPMPCH
jgi:vibriolysin